MTEDLSILWLKSGPLYPLDTGGKKRTYNMLKELNGKHRVTYLSLSSSGGRPDGPEDYAGSTSWVPWSETPKGSVVFFADIARNWLASRRPYVIDKYMSGEMCRRIVELDSSGRLDLILCDFLTPAVNLFAGGYRPQTKTVIFQHNVESIIWQRMAESAPNPLAKFYLEGQCRRMRKFEREACAACDGVIGVSEEDCRVMREELGLKNVLGSSETGVDLDFFKPDGGLARDPARVVFLGSMDWMANIDAVTYFLEASWPAVKRAVPEATFWVVGRNPPDKVKDLAAPDPSVHVTGTVDDIRPYVHESSVMVVPLRIGGGTRIKIFEAMAMGIPVVSTAVGAEGLPVADGEHVLLAEGPDDFSVAVVRLLGDQRLQRDLAENARDLVASRYSWAAVTAHFETLFRRV